MPGFNITPEARFFKARGLGVLALFLLALVVILHLFITSMLAGLERDAEKEALRRVGLRSETAAALIEHDLEGFEAYWEMAQDRASLAASSDVMALGAARRIGLWTATRHFGVFRVQDFGPDGRLRWSSGSEESARPVDPALLEKAREADGFLVGDPAIDAATERRTIVFYKAMLDPSGAFNGVAALSVDQDALAEQFAAASGRPGENIMLFRDDGLLLMGMKNSPDGPVTSFETRRIPLGNLRMDARVTSLFDHEDRFMTHRQIDGQPLVIGVSTPSWLEMADHVRLRRLFHLIEGAFALLLVGWAGVGALFYARQRAAHEVTELENRQKDMVRVLDGLGAGIVVRRLRPDGTMIRDYTSARIFRAYGVPSGNTTWLQQLLNETNVAGSNTEREAFYAALRRDGALNFDRQVTFPNGMKRWVRFAFNVIGRIGTEIQFVGLVTDIELEKVAQQQREDHDRARLEELRRVLDGIDGAVFLSTVSPAGDYTREFMSAGARRLMRLGENGLYDDDFVLAHIEPPVDPALRRQGFEHLLRYGSDSREGQLRCADGSLRWVRLSVSVIGRVGEQLEVVGLIMDIEAEKAAEASAMSNARLATLGEMSSGLAHEINQPLGVIALAADTAIELLRRDPVAMAPKVLDRLERIMAMTGRGREIVDHLRLFARRQEPDLEVVSLHEVLEGAMLLTHGTLRDQGVEVTRDISPDLPRVRGRRVLLEQVLMNLFLNAAHAMATTPPDRRHLSISAWPCEDEVRLEVTDTGPGIPADVMPRLFEPFFTTKPPGQGTGLGLSICHGIITACGGTITAANVPGGGAAFTMTLKRAEAPPVPAEPVPSQAALVD